MEQDSMGEAEDSRGLVFRSSNGNLMLLEDFGEDLRLKPVTDYNKIYETLEDDAASIVAIKRQPFGGVLLKDIAILNFCNNCGETKCNAEEAIKYALNNDPHDLLVAMYNDPELNK